MADHIHSDGTTTPLPRSAMAYQNNTIFNDRAAYAQARKIRQPRERKEAWDRAHGVKGNSGDMDAYLDSLPEA